MLGGDHLISAIKSVASLIFHTLTYEFHGGGISFSLWDIFVTFFICGLIGLLIYYLVVGIVENL